MGVAQVIVSSTALENINTIIKALDAEKYFDKFFSGEDLPSKPDPAVFSMAIKHYGVAPEECLVFEDSPHGISAAKSIGLKCVAAAVTYPRESLSGADLVLEDLDKLQIRDIQKLFKEDQTS